MRTIKLLVTIEVENDYIVDDPSWTLENAVTGNENIEIVDVTIAK